MSARRNKRLASRIYDLMASVRAVRDNEVFNIFTYVLSDLRKWANREHLTFSVVGGVAAIYYGWASTTDDVDIALKSSDEAKMLKTASQYGFEVVRRSKEAWHTLKHVKTSIFVDIVPEGGKSEEDSPYRIPGPHQYGALEGYAMAPLKGWLELKLIAFRLKDKVHIINVLRQQSPEKIQELREYIKTRQAGLSERLEEMIIEMEHEKEMDRQHDVIS